MQSQIAFSQTINIDSSATEIYIIDSYITPEQPHKLILSYATSDSCKSSVRINKNRSIEVSKEFTDTHKLELELTKEELETNIINYQIFVSNKSNIESKSEDYFIELPKETILTEERDINWTQMCIGGLVFAIPTFEYSVINGKEFLGLSKEIPLINFYGKGYNYPQGYIGVEYSHYFNSEKKNFLRFGYKHIFQLAEIKYISPGLTFFGDFKGYNGLSAEFSLGLFQIKNIFTVFTRYRYNFQLKKNGTDFYEFSLGLYSNFFSLNF